MLGIEQIRKERPILIKTLEDTMKYIFKKHLYDIDDVLIPCTNRIITINLVLLQEGWSCDFKCTSPLPCHKKYTINGKAFEFRDIIQQTINQVIKEFEENSTS